MDKKLIFTILVGILTSCSFGEKSLDSMQSRELTFDELPKELKEVYQESALAKKGQFLLRDKIAGLGK